jgi:hypothetical protein
VLLAVIAGVVVIGAIGLALTEWLRFPAPYDRAPQQRQETVGGDPRAGKR